MFSPKSAIKSIDFAPIHEIAKFASLVSPTMLRILKFIGFCLFLVSHFLD